MLTKNKRSISTLLVATLLSGSMISDVSAMDFVITENGSDSASEVNLTQESQTSVQQENLNETTNNIDSNSSTGENSVSSNTNGDASITTGDVIDQLNVENSGNTSTVNTGCCSSDTNSIISGNGSGSENTVRLNSSSTTTIVSNQTATITNNITGTASTGSNSVNYNTGGNVSISTGDINVSAKVINAPINTGSINVKSGSQDLTAMISGNGYDSVNDISANFIDNSNIYSNFSADINNYFLWDLETGNNEANGNSGGDVDIKTGDISLEVFIRNFVNLGKVNVYCCKDDADPKDKESIEQPKEKEDNKNGDGGKGGNGGGGGQILSEAAAVEAGGPGINGLSDTSSANAQSLLFWLALGFMAIGGKIIVEELFPKSVATSFKKRVK